MKKGMQIKRLFSVFCVAVLSACGGGGGSTQASGNAGASSQTSATMNLASLNVSAAGYKRLTLYGRDRDEIGYESAYLSCQTGSPGCQ